MSNKTYRGIEVPDDGAGSAWRAGVDAALGIAAPLVESLRYDSACSFDHRGYCQEHTHLEAGPCPDGVAREFLAAVDSAGRYEA